MRIVYVSKALTVAAYRDKIGELASRIDITAVVPEEWDGNEPEPSPPGMPLPQRVPVRLSGRNHLHHYPRAALWLDQLAPDLVHVDEEPYSLVTLQLGRLCRRREIPFVFFAWQNLRRRLPPPFAQLQHWVFRNAHGGIAGTDAAAAVLRDAGFDRQLRVIPQFGVDPSRFTPDPVLRRQSRQELDLGPGAFVIGYGGRLVREKGVHVLLEAFERLFGPDPDHSPHLIIIGDGPERARLESGVARAGVASHVHFLGHVPSTGMPAALSAVDVLALPSLGTSTWVEQFGRILVEAMACGVPVVGSRCGEIPDVIGDAGMVVPSGDPRALAAALDRLRQDEDLRTRNAVEGRQRVVAEFTQERIAERTLEFYEELLGAEAAT